MKEQYLLGEGIHMHEEEDLLDIMNTQGIYKDEFDILRQSGNISTKLVYHKGYLTAVKEIDALNNINIDLNAKLRNQKYAEIPRRRIHYMLNSTMESHSHFGEDEFHAFSMPVSELINSPFQVIGKLSQKEPIFTWLPFEEFFLTYPLFTEIMGCLYLDYSNPTSPEVYAVDYEINYPHGEIAVDRLHKFQKTNIAIRSIKDLNEEQDLDFDHWYIGITGVPFWIQHAEIPKCPKTGKRMKFICQINSMDSIKVTQSDILNERIPFVEMHTSLSFWGSGTLFVFIEPESKIVGYLIQNT